MNLRVLSGSGAQNCSHIGDPGPFLATNLCYLRQYRLTLCSFCMSCYVGLAVQWTVSFYLATISAASRSTFHSHLWGTGRAIAALGSALSHLPTRSRFARNLTRSAEQFQISGFLNNLTNAHTLLRCCRMNYAPFRKKICTGGRVYVACLRQ